MKKPIEALITITVLSVIGSVSRWPGSQLHGSVISQLVSVVNTNMSPIPVSVDSDARTPWVGTGFCPETQTCEIVYPAVPTGHRLVTEDVNVIVTMGSTLPTAGPQILLNGGAGSIGLSSGFGTSGEMYQAYSNTQLVYYIDASTGSRAAVRVKYLGKVESVNVVVTGYLLNCRIAACSAIINAVGTST